MNKIWAVALYEYKRNVFKRSFLLVLLSIPLMIGFNIALGIFMESAGRNTTPVGYVDQAGLLDEPVLPDGREKNAVELIPYDTEEEALVDLEAGLLQAYYVLPGDYFATKQIELKYLEEPGANATSYFYDFVRLNLLRGQPPEVVAVATGETSISIRSADGSRFLPGGEVTVGMVLPPIIGIVFAVLLIMSSSYVMQAVADEKENRTMEVLVTSVSPAKLIGGKILGVVAISLTQIVVWTAFAVVGVVLAGNAGIEFFQDLDIEWGSILVTLGVALPAYVTSAGLMAAIGATVTSVQEGQSVGAIFFVLHMLPTYVAVAVVETPNAALPVALTFTPFTALMTVGMRQLFTTLPLWQVACAICLQVVYALGALALAGRALRLGMLRYGQRLSVRELLGRVRARARRAA
jgi:ABC-2 type transport system permease protein